MFNHFFPSSFYISYFLISLPPLMALNSTFPPAKHRFSLFQNFSESSYRAIMASSSSVFHKGTLLRKNKWSLERNSKFIKKSNFFDSKSGHKRFNFFDFLGTSWGRRRYYWMEKEVMAVSRKFFSGN